MPTTNPLRRFRALLPAEPLLYAEVLAHNSDGSSTVETPEGNTFRARGTSVSVGDYAYIQGGRILEAAPDLPLFTETV